MQGTVQSSIGEVKSSKSRPRSTMSRVRKQGPLGRVASASAIDRPRSKGISEKFKASADISRQSA